MAFIVLGLYSKLMACCGYLRPNLKQNYLMELVNVHPWSKVRLVVANF